MKGRESGMPDESCWQDFFDAECVIDKMDCAKQKTENIVEFGSGYGTFTLAVAHATSGVVRCFDIEPELVEMVQVRAKAAGLTNVQIELRDFVAEGTGLAEGSMDHAMLYNILHIEDPVSLLSEAFRILRPGGLVSIIHWKPDPSTPRGPSIAIRPLPEQCQTWAELAGFKLLRHQDLSECCKYHYGMLLQRPCCASD